MTSEALPSVHDLVPRERGGPEARRGFTFQDHVAAGFYIEMVRGGSIATVWCEADDDITLVLDLPGDAAEVEFVQVKSDEPNQLWSVSMLCRRSPGDDGEPVSGSSMLEKSLARDRYRESARFRIVTAWPVQDDLKVLCLPLDHPNRHADAPTLARLVARIPTRLQDCRSEKGTDVNYWLVRTVWDVRHSREAVENQNLIRLDAVLHGIRAGLSLDQRVTIYGRLIARARDAAEALGAVHRERKRMQREELLGLLRQAAEDALRAGASGTESPLEAKMRSANLDETTIRYASEIRLRFLRERRRGAYFSTVDLDHAEGEVASRLHRLWMELQAGELTDEPRSFYRRCLDSLEDLRLTALARLALPSYLLEGMMYEAVFRCLHRFERASL